MRPALALLAFGCAALGNGPAPADCARSQLGPMCQWEDRIAVEEWRVQQRAEAEVRARMGPRPAEEVVRHWRAFDLSKFPEER
jgi:hypothetical protein